VGTPPASGPATCAPEVGFDQAVQCDITRAGEQRSHTFPGAAGERVAVRLTGAGNIAPQSEVLRPDGSLACGPGYGDIEECTLDATGTHTIVVEDGLGTRTGSYVLLLERR
jgi:hypothetical protein